MCYPGKGERSTPIPSTHLVQSYSPTRYFVMRLMRNSKSTFLAKAPHDLEEVPIAQDQLLVAALLVGVALLWIEGTGGPRGGSESVVW